VCSAARVNSSGSEELKLVAVTMTRTVKTLSNSR
jgi:hypothetical protein